VKKFLQAACAAALMVAPTAAFAACDDGEIVVKFSHVTMCMEVFPNSTLYNDNKVLEAMLQGDVQLAAPSLSKFEKFTKQFRIFDLPFMFKDINAVEAFQASEAGVGMLNSMQKRGLQGLAYWHNGMKQMSANKPLVAPTDANGLKFRVQSSDVLVAQMEAIGGSPQKMAFSEVYGALQQGVVDGQENTWSNIFGKKFFEVQDGVTQTDHGIIDYLLVTSVDWLEALPADVRDQFMTIVAEVTEARNSESTAVNASAKQAIVDAGGVVRTLTSEQRQAWVDVMKPVWAKFANDVGQDNIDAAQKINMTN